MTKKEVIKKIKSVNWYRQGGACLPYYVSIPYRAAFNLYDGFAFYQGKNNYGYFNRDIEKNFCQKAIKGQFKNKKYVVKSYLDPWFKIKKEQDNFCRKLSRKILAGLPEKKFLGIHEQFNDLRMKIWKRGILIEAFDPWGKMIIDEHLAKNSLDILPEDLAVLVGPTELGFIQKELLDRLLIVRKSRKEKDISFDLLKHTRKYHWLKNTWADVFHLTEGYFSKLIRKDAKKDTKTVNRQIKDLQEYEGQRKNKIKQLIRKYRIPAKTVNILELFSVMSNWRDVRKVQMMKVNSLADSFLKELGKRAKIKKNYLLYLDPYETVSIEYLKGLGKELKEREKSCFYCIFDKTKIKWFIGKQALEIHDLLENKIIQSGEIRGVTASEGKAVGRTRVIVSLADFKKMKLGDILVTQMTRPEYLPVIKKAGAIITDEGGITCHAAIISRELNIPCVIGTQIATSVLKDGNLVEVDANKGVVKRLS